MRSMTLWHNLEVSDTLSWTHLPKKEMLTNLVEQWQCRQWQHEQQQMSSGGDASWAHWWVFVFHYGKSLFTLQTEQSNDDKGNVHIHSYNKQAWWIQQGSEMGACHMYLFPSLFLYILTLHCFYITRNWEGRSNDNTWEALTTMTGPAAQGDGEPPLMRRDHHGQRWYQQWWGVIVSKEELPLTRGSPQRRWGATAGGGDWRKWAITDEEGPLLAMTNSNWWGGSTTDKGGHWQWCWSVTGNFCN